MTGPSLKAPPSKRTPIPELRRIDLKRQSISSHHIARIPSSRRVSWLLRLVDLLTFVIVYAMVYYLRVGEIPYNLYTSKRFAAIALLMLGSLWLTDSHRVDHVKPAWSPGMRILAATSLAGLALGALVYLLGPEFLDEHYSLLGRSIILPTLVVFAVLAILVRYKLWLWMRKVSQSSRWLVVAGSTDQGMSEFWKEAIANKTGALSILVDRLPEVIEPGTPAPDGTWRDLPERLRENWSGVILSSHVSLPDLEMRELLSARLNGLPVLELADFYEQYWSRVPVTNLRGEWIALSHGFELLHNPTQMNLKRFCDILLAGGLLLVAAPLMLFVAIAIKVDSRGSILFKQVRVGRMGKEFVCLKFRTMYWRTPKDDPGSRFTRKNDKRLTRIGGFMRKVRIDELPQLFNVLRGDMSFIGPRAEWNNLVKDYEVDFPYYHLRHLVRPGLTGWAQVNYPYGTTYEDTRHKLEYDLYYIKFHSIYLDIVIVLRTIRVCLFGLGSR